MYTKNLLITSVVLAVVGIVALWRIGSSYTVIAAPAPDAHKVPKEMLEKRRDAAKQTWQMKLELGQRAFTVRGDFNPKISDVLGWSERWLDAELALCEKKKDRIEAFKAHVDRTREVEQIAIF